MAQGSIKKGTGSSYKEKSRKRNQTKEEYHKERKKGMRCQIW